MSMVPRQYRSHPKLAEFSSKALLRISVRHMAAHLLTMSSNMLENTTWKQQKDLGPPDHLMISRFFHHERLGYMDLYSACGNWEWTCQAGRLNCSLICSRPSTTACSRAELRQFRRGRLTIQLRSNAISTNIQRVSVSAGIFLVQ